MISTLSPSVAADNRTTDFGGMITSDAAGRTLADEEGTTYAYDVFGRLSRAGQFEGKTYDFTYDALGRLESWDDGGEEIAILYAGGKIIRTNDGAGDTWVSDRFSTVCEASLQAS